MTPHQRYSPVDTSPRRGDHLKRTAQSKAGREKKGEKGGGEAGRTNTNKKGLVWPNNNNWQRNTRAKGQKQSKAGKVQGAPQHWNRGPAKVPRGPHPTAPPHQLHTSLPAPTHSLLSQISETFLARPVQREPASTWGRRMVCSEGCSPLLACGGDPPVVVPCGRAPVVVHSILLRFYSSQKKLKRAGSRASRDLSRSVSRIPIRNHLQNSRSDSLMRKKPDSELIGELYNGPPT